MEGKELLLDQQIKELKDTMVQGFADIKGQIANLTADVKALNTAFNSQDKKLAIINTDMINVKEKVAELEKQTDKNHDDIIKIQTDADATRRTYNWLIGLVSFFLTALNFMLRFFGGR